MRMPIIIPIGSIFGRLKVISEGIKKENDPHIYFECLCECGNRKIIQGYSLRKITKSCGCLSKEICGNRARKHGDVFTSTYNSWSSMKDRCRCKTHPAFKNYGGRGISFTERWLDYNNFKEDMGIKPQGTELDRGDNNGNYCKENCRWVPFEINNRNKRSNINITYLGKTMCISEWAREVGLSKTTINRRFKAGWSAEEIITKRSRRIK